MILPNECVAKIFSRVDQETCFQLRLTCHWFENVIKQFFIHKIKKNRLFNSYVNNLDLSYCDVFRRQIKITNANKCIEIFDTNVKTATKIKKSLKGFCKIRITKNHLYYLNEDLQLWSCEFKSGEENIVVDSEIIDFDTNKDKEDIICITKDGEIYWFNKLKYVAVRLNFDTSLIPKRCFTINNYFVFITTNHILCLYIGEWFYFNVYTISGVVPKNVQTINKYGDFYQILFISEDLHLYLLEFQYKINGSVSKPHIKPKYNIHNVRKVFDIKRYTIVLHVDGTIKAYTESGCFKILSYAKRIHDMNFTKLSKYITMLYFIDKEGEVYLKSI